MMKKIIVSIVLLAVVLLQANAQLVYSCDFETPAENAQWTMNQVATAHASKLQNHWVIGPAGQAGLSGNNGLFVSRDSVHAEYAASGYEVLCFRAMTLPTGTYKLRFDWRAMGRSQTEGMYVAWLPQSRSTNSAGTAVPTWMTNVNNLHCHGEGGWTSSEWQFTVSANDTNGKLVFLWWESAEERPNNPSACVDNIEIVCTAQDPCTSVVSNMSYNSTTKAIEWTGTAATYDVRVYNQYDDSWQEYPGIVPQVNPTTRKNTFSVPGLEEGQNRFFVRGVCDAVSHGAWGKLSAFTFIKGLRCLDYFDIGTTQTTNLLAGQFANAGLCYNATYAQYTSGQRGTLGIIQPEGNGPGNPSNQSTTHAIHTNRYETDPNTSVNGGLRTVAPGEIASVRLGAYDGSGQSASVEYKYKVQAGMSDLLVLKYAVVLYSGGHEPEINPRFTLDILDGNGHQFASSCSHLLFMCGDQLLSPNSGWTKEGDYYWKDWDTVTVSLREYVGQTITIKLTSIRCTYDTHFAKAYYAIGCESGDLQGLSCGDFSTDHFEAPDGFDYEWYQESDRSTILGTNKILNIGIRDTATYILRCKSKNDPSCYFELVANPNPRFPFIEVTHEHKPANCLNTVEFTNTSYVGIVNRETGMNMERDTTMSLDHVRFEWGDGSEDVFTLDTIITHDFPASGGSFPVRITASMNGGICDTSVVYTLDLPDLTTATSYHTIHLCEGDSYKDHLNKMHTTSFSDTIVSPNQYGCEALDITDVYFHPTNDTTFSAEICQGGAYLFFGDELAKTGKYTHTMINQYGCDSVITLNLLVRDSLDVTLQDTILSCGEENNLVISYTVNQGMLDSVRVLFDKDAQKAGFKPMYVFSKNEQVVIPIPATVKPDYYNLSLDFGSIYCPKDLIKVCVQRNYSREIYFERWQDVLLISNADYNGGYEFSHFQWYKNGQVLEGDTLSYLNVPDAKGDDDFYVVLTTVDGIVMPACEINWGRLVTGLDDLNASITVAPTLVEAGGVLRIQASGTFSIYNVLGEKVSSHPVIAPEMPTQVVAPIVSGIYLINVDNSEKSVKVIVK